MSHSSRAASALAALRTPRRPRRHTRLASSLAVAGTAALLGLGAVTRPAQAMPPEYERCLSVVDNFYRACSDSTDSWLGEAACQWTAGVGIMACAAAEAARLWASQISPPAY